MITSNDTILYKKKGFNGQEYIKNQRKAIMDKLSILKNGKLYLEINGDFLQEADIERILPGYIIDSQKNIFTPIKEEIEILFCIDADDILFNKENTINITNSIIRKTEIEIGLKPNIVINNIDIQSNFDKILEFEQEFQRRNYKVWERYKIGGYPNNIKSILSNNGFGNDDHIPLTKKLILVINQSKENKNKSATCLGQIYNDTQIGLESSYAIYTTFPITKLGNNHPINLAYQSSILDDNITITNQENTIQSLAILQKIAEKSGSTKDYKSLNEIEINELNSCITDDEIISIACYQEIQRRKERNPETNLENLEKDIKEYAQKKGYNLNQKIY